MAKIDDYGLHEFVGSGTINRGRQRVRFERTQKTLADWCKENGRGALGDFYAWLDLPADQPER